MKKNITILRLMSVMLVMSVSPSAHAAAPEIKSREELLSIVINSEKFEIARGALGESRGLRSISFSQTKLSQPLSISFTYVGSKLPPCTLVAKIPIHFEAPTEVISICAVNQK